MHFFHILLQAAAPAKQPPGNSMIMNVLMIGLFIAVFYFFMMRPQVKKQKEQKNYLGNLKKGDKVVTIGGIIGKITEIRSKSYIIEVEGGGKLNVMQSAISLEFSKSLNSETEEKKD